MNKALLNLLVLFILGINLNAQCDIRDLVVQRTACDANENFGVIIDFVHDDVGDLGFRVQGNGVNYGEYAYDALPITLTDLNGDCETQFEFVIRDIADPTCSANYELGEVCCNLACEIEIVDLALSECINGGYNATFDLVYAQTLNVGVDVYANDQFIGFYSYNDLPIIIEDIPSVSDLDNTIVVCDNDNPTCCDTISFVSPCVCNISNIRSRIIECNEADSTFYVQFDFDTNMVSDSFQVGGNSIFFGTKSYDDLPTAIGPIPFTTDTTYYLFVDKRNTFCFEEMIIPPVQECNTDCLFDNVAITVSDCIEEESFFATITFDVNNPGLNGFTIRGNGVVYASELAYGQESYIVGPLEGDCETLYEFILIDNDLDDCRGETFLTEPICCMSCSISDVIVEWECDGDSINNIVIDFDYNYSMDSTFMVDVNSLSYGPYHFDDLPLSIAVALSGDEEIRVEVQDLQNQECSDVLEFTPDCGELACGQFVNIFTEYGDCLEENTYFLDIEFELEGEHSDSFLVVVGEIEFGPFSHGETSYTVGPLLSDCTRTILTFIDQGRPDCTQVYEIDEIKCCDECEIGDIVTNIQCFENTMVGFSIMVEAAGQLSSTYNVIIGNDAFGPFNYGESNFINVSLADGTYTITVEDVEFDDCMKQDTLIVLCTEIEECLYDSLVVATVNCTEETFQFVIYLAHNRADSDLFQLYINDELKGSSTYSFLPFTTPLLNRNDGGPWHILLRDLELQDCVADITIDEEVCETSTSDLADLVQIISNESGVLLRSNVDVGTYNLSIYDILGRKITSSVWSSSGELQLMLDSNSAGINIITLEQNGVIYSKKLLRY